MKKLILLTLAAIFSFPLIAQTGESRFMKYPSIHGDKIVFSYDTDLWTISTKGGTAEKLTSLNGIETAPKFSPDGKTIAFTSNYEGTNNIYTISSKGEDLKRVTYSPSGQNQTVGWTPDGKKIVMRSYYEVFVSRDPELYFIDKNGSAPERFPIDRGSLCSFNKSGDKMLYNRKGSEEYYWKNYKGGWHTDIWMYDFKTKKFSPISTYIGKNAYPMWVGDNMYFVSDSINGIANIYSRSLKDNSVKQITNYSDYDVMFPETDGKNIVYMQNGYLNILDINSGKVTTLSVTVPSEKKLVKDRVINAKEYIHSFDVSGDGKVNIMEARGDIYKVLSDTSINLTNSAGSKEMLPQISPDGKRVAYFSDKSGEYNLYIQDINGGEVTPLTTDMTKLPYRLVWSPDGSKLLFGNQEYSIYYIDINTKKLTKVDEFHQVKNDEFVWEQADYSWSPDSKWITYGITNYNRNNQIFVYNLETAKKSPVTDDFFDNLNPVFDANGKYLYYLSSQSFDIQMDFYEDNHVMSTPQKIMVVQLNKDDAAPLLDSLKAPVENNGTVKIDFDNIEKRTFQLPVKAGNYFYLKAGNNKVLWASVDKFTEEEYEEIFKPNKGETKWTLHIFDMPTKKEITMTDKIADYAISVNRENLIINAEKEYYNTSLKDAYISKSIGSKLKMDNMSYTVKNYEEFNQIFMDTWRLYRDFFYDTNMHGHNWQKMGEGYKSYIPYLTNREELNWVLSQMVGELCVSHTYVGGGDTDTLYPQSKTFTGWMGADLIKDKSGFYKISKIYGPTKYDFNIKSPLGRPDINVKEGDYLIAINGKVIKTNEDYFKYCQIQPGEKTKLTFNSEPSEKGAVTYNIQLTRNSSQARYVNWIANNIEKISKETNGRVGYVHINAMGSGGIGEFEKYWRAFRYKDGLIVDVRRNGGGWTEYFIIDKLERKTVGLNNLRGMVPFRYPGSSSIGNYAVISNEFNGSDGEAFLMHFRARNLGTIIGTPSWGGLVGIMNAQTTIDNGSINQSNNAFYGKEGKWWIENHGGDPDIYIDNDPQSVMDGHDAQLEKAIEVMKEKIEQNKFSFPQKPAYPVR